MSLSCDSMLPTSCGFTGNPSEPPLGFAIGPRGLLCERADVRVCARAETEPVCVHGQCTSMRGVSPMRTACAPIDRPHLADIVVRDCTLRLSLEKKPRGPGEGEELAAVVCRRQARTMARPNECTHTHTHTHTHSRNKQRRCVRVRACVCVCTHRRLSAKGHLRCLSSFEI